MRKESAGGGGKKCIPLLKQEEFSQRSFRAGGAALVPAVVSQGSCAQERLKLQAPQPPSEILIWGLWTLCCKRHLSDPALNGSFEKHCPQTPPLGFFPLTSPAALTHLEIWFSDQSGAKVAHRKAEDSRAG